MSFTSREETGHVLFLKQKTETVMEAIGNKISI